ncbi:hypothetical protein ETI05_03545 [Macrococcoides canis]|uniref:YopX protein domain-containing protein n=1 Tax=Macrococcoides canis TaxID=1855823 RepID=A0A4V3BG94_9STAP|nr:YopX family protein [Macrococcus canis]TDM18105.1 hypothetical protein ETI04_01045 [Macrococcus canis]TDM21829.1 hypothetical protein ETI05_03545 [Macrococcus canis]
MENLKFRVWDRYDKCMSNDVYLTGQTFYESLNEILADEQYILMQSTGLRDKNGKEIYEGDIVECYTEGLSVVEFVEGVFGLRCNGYFEGFNLVNGQCVIIGNIHEHSELLEEDGDVIDKN